METESVKIKAFKSIFNKQRYFNAVVDVLLLTKMKKVPTLPESCNMIFINEDNYTWDEKTSTMIIKDLTKLEYLLSTGDLDIANDGDMLPFVMCNKNQKNSLFYE